MRWLDGIRLLSGIRSVIRRGRKEYKKFNPEGKPLDYMIGGVFVKRYPNHVQVVADAIEHARIANPDISNDDLAKVAIVRLIQHVA